MFRPPLPSIALAVVVLSLSPLVHAAPGDITLTDTEGRSIVGKVEAFTGDVVKFRIIGKPAVNIPLSKLSEESKDLLGKLELEGKIGGESWPEKAPLPFPYKFESAGDVWTGAHVRIEFAEAPKSRAASAPEAVFLRTLDTVIAAAKAMPLGGIIDRDKKFECRVLTPFQFSTLKAKLDAREKAALLPPPAPGPTPDGQRKPIFKPLLPPVTPTEKDDLSATFFVNWAYDENDGILYFRSDVPQDFLAPDPKEGRWIPMAQRHRQIQTIAVILAFGERLKEFPDELIPGLFTYFETISQVAGEKLEYSDIHPGMKELLSVGVPRIVEGTRINIIPNVGKTSGALYSGDFPEEDTDLALVIYYLLHLDGQGNGSGLAAWFKAMKSELAVMQSKIDEANAAMVDFQFKISDFNREVDAYNARVHAFNDARSKGLPRNLPGDPPVEPIKPEILNEFSAGNAMESLYLEAKNKALVALKSGRTSEEFAADFRQKIEKSAK